MLCFRCSLDAGHECARCGALYCDDHGDALCERCMDPEMAVPSYRLYRGSLLALLIGSVAAVWLVVLPPATADDDAPPGGAGSVIVTPTPTPDDTEPPGETSLLPGTDTPASTSDGSATTYTVESGDSLVSIAAQFADNGDIEAMVEAIVEANEIDDPAELSVGQELVIPQ